MSIPSILYITGERGYNRSIHKVTGGRPTKHKGGWKCGCKVMVMQANWVGSWRWACGLVHCYWSVFDLAWVSTQLCCVGFS
jgi:hypothetical protein